jgi:hypothetical protein
MHHANNASDLCVLLHNYNTSFCSSENEKLDTKAKSKPISYDVMSIRVLEHEYIHGAQDMHKVCPIINFIARRATRKSKFGLTPKSCAPC